MQLEVEFETLALLEQFWAAIPPVEHKAWSQQARVSFALAFSCLRMQKGHHGVNRALRKLINAASSVSDRGQLTLEGAQNRLPVITLHEPALLTGCTRPALCRVPKFCFLLQNFIIDGSPRWEIYRTCPIFAAEQNSKADPVSATLPSKADPVSATLKAWESASAAKAEKDATSSVSSLQQPRCPKSSTVTNFQG